MNNRMIGFSVALICLVISGASLSAQTGTIKDLYPPGNGTGNGAGFITGDDGSFHVFQTPRDNNGEALKIGSIVFYEIAKNGKIKNVTTDSSLLIFKGASIRVDVSPNPDSRISTTPVTTLVVSDKAGNETAHVVMKSGQSALITPTRKNGINDGKIKVKIQTKM